MLIRGDARRLPLVDASVNCVVTSPPYWGLRDYRTGRWEGGDPSCAHQGRPKPRQDTTGSGAKKGRFAATRGTQPGKCAYQVPLHQVCRCGAVRIDRQVGLEQTPDEYVASLVEVFMEIWRVLRDDGTVWLNLGDCYVTNPIGAGSAFDPKWKSARDRKEGLRANRTNRPSALGLKHKDMVGIPWRVAFALQAAGWYLRSDIVWSKPNPMPESTTDRPTTSHEHIFLLAKSGDTLWWRHRDTRVWRSTRPVPDYRWKDRQNGGTDTAMEPPDWLATTFIDRGRDVRRWSRVNLWQGYDYWYDADAIREPYAESTLLEADQGYDGLGLKDYEGAGVQNPSDTKRRIIESIKKRRSVRDGIDTHGGGQGNGLISFGGAGRNKRSVWTVATQPYDGAHFATFPEALIEPCILAGCPLGGLVLDPFVGSGTTVAVAQRLSRRGVGVDLNYQDLSSERTAQRGLIFAEASA